MREESVVPRSPRAFKLPPPAMVVGRHLRWSLVVIICARGTKSCRLVFVPESYHEGYHEGYSKGYLEGYPESYHESFWMFEGFKSFTSWKTVVIERSTLWWVCRYGRQIFRECETWNRGLMRMIEMAYKYDLGVGEKTKNLQQNPKKINENGRRGIDLFE